MFFVFDLFITCLLLDGKRAKIFHSKKIQTEREKKNVKYVQSHLQQPTHFSKSHQSFCSVHTHPIPLYFLQKMAASVESLQLSLIDKALDKPEMVLSEKRVTAFLYSASWCPPCRAFSPLLKTVYAEAQAANISFEIVYVSSDEDQDTFDTYRETMPWCAISFDKESTRRKLGELHAVNGIPMLIVVDSQGRTITKEGRSMISRDKLAAVSRWCEHAPDVSVTDSSFSSSISSVCTASGSSITNDNYLSSSLMAASNSTAESSSGTTVSSSTQTTTTDSQ